MFSRIALEIGGSVLILYGLREVFRDIFHPSRSGTMSDYIGRSFSLLMRRTRFRPALGPLALITVVLCWVGLITVGFALIYCALLPTDMTAPQVEQTGFARNLLRSLYFSLGALDTFNTFDLSARSDWLKLVVAVEGLIGISMITASVSWLVLLYPAISRSRHFARRASALLQAESRCGLSIVREIGAPILLELSDRVLQFRLDVMLFPILLNFYPSDEGATVSHVLPEIHRLAIEAKSREGDGGTQLAGVQLEIALGFLAGIIAEEALRMKIDRVETTFLQFHQRFQ
jgi:hypothetical protein